MPFWQWVGAPCCVVCTAATGGTPQCRREGGGGIEKLYPPWHSDIMYVLLRRRIIMHNKFTLCLGRVREIKTSETSTNLDHRLRTNIQSLVGISNPM